MKNLLADFFFFNKKERQGIYFLIMIIILVASSNFIFPVLHNNNESLIKAQSNLIFTYDSILNSVAIEQDTVYELFEFDPNKLMLEQWLKLGLKPKQASVILNYLKKGGCFKKKEDLKKIYSISDGTYKRLEPYIKIDKSSFSRSNSKTQKTNFEPLELNAADSSDLITIHGIGPVFASRIIKYRNLLGGYHSVDQLREIYGIDSLKYESIKPHFTSCDLHQIRTINLNTASFKELLKHPYISYDFTKNIVNRRKKVVFKNAEDVFNIQFISNSNFEKLLPYLITK